MVAAAAALLFAPALALLALVGGGELRPGPAALAFAWIVVVWAILGVAVRADLRTLHRTLRGRHAGRLRFPSSSGLAAGIDRLRREHESERAELARALQAEAAIVERLPDPVLVLDRNRAVLRANPAARATFGTDLAAVLRQPALTGAVAQALATGTPAIAELAVAAPVPREVVATVVATIGGGGGEVIAVLSDRTRDRAVERMRADFAANASHELRTPLASLIGFIDTLRGPARDDAEARARFLDIMAAQAARMNRLIGDLLSLSRIELVEHQTPTGTVDLPALVAREAAGLEPLLSSGQARLVVDIAPGLPLVAGDADQLTQVLHNLIDNAVKYGREGGEVRVRAALAAPGGRWPSGPGIVLTVSDDGPGIARSDLPRLTERFYRVDKARSRAAGGTGLGLAIVKHIVNRHRGQLAVESTEGAGTTVSVWLPASPASDGSRR